jgi:hypothetical protein
MSDDFYGQVMEFRLRGGPIEAWMEIPFVSIPLEKIYQVHADAFAIEPVVKWRERLVLPKVLYSLEVFCDEHGIDGYDSFTAFCNGLADPSSALSFSPLEHPLLVLGVNELHAHIDAASALREASVPSKGPHCVLNARFVGVAARQLRLLLKDIIRPSSSGYRRSPSRVPSMWTLVQEAPAVLTSENDCRYLTSDAAGRARSPTTDSSSTAAAYVSPDDADFYQYEQEEITFGAFEVVGEIDATTHLFSGGAAFRTTPVTTRSNTPFAAVCTRLGLLPLRIDGLHAPVIETVHSNDVEELNTVAQLPVSPHSDGAASTTASPATTERPSQRERPGRHDAVPAPIYHVKNETDQQASKELRSTTMRHVSFGTALSQGISGDTSFSSFSVARTRQGCPFVTDSHRVPIIETGPDDDTEDDATVALPPIQRDSTAAQSTTVSLAATERAQRRRNGGHDDVTSPPYHHEIVSGHTGGVSTVMAPCVPFDVMPSRGFPGDALLSHLTRRQAGFDVRSML